ncbi:MAG: TerC family protein [Planctomycetota bacterium]
MTTPILWTVFGIVVAVMMALDLGVFHRKAHEVSVKEALTWTAVWVALGLGFGVFLLLQRDRATAAEYFACYLTEYALSVDNIFVFLVIFTYFGVPGDCRHRVLFWGILGALAMRAVFLTGGIVLIEKFHWMIYILGAILIITGIKLFRQTDEKLDPEKNFVLRLAKRFLPVTEQYEGQNFFVVREGRRVATPLFLTLLVVESTDVMFAVDSVPAALSLSKNLLVVYTSNVFAILGLRSLFFAVAGLLQFLHYLKYGLSAILVFVGIKMILPEDRKIPIEYALSIVGGILVLAILASMIRSKLVSNRKEEAP